MCKHEKQSRHYGDGLDGQLVCDVCGAYLVESYKGKGDKE